MKTLTTPTNLLPHVAQLDIACSRGDRRGRVSVAWLVDQHGIGAALREAVGHINADCPKADAQA